MPHVVIQPGTPEERTVRLRPGDNLFGRGATNDVIINHPSVSTCHCNVQLNEATVRVIDLGSTNGTFIDDRPVRDSALEPGALFRMGDVPVLFDSGELANAPVVLPFPRPRSREERLAALTTQLRIADSSAPVAETQLEREVPPLAPHLVNHPVFCRYHRMARASFWCLHCKKALCELCVSPRSDRICLSCGQQCAPLVADFSSLDREPPTFYQSLPGAFAYPFRSDAPYMLAGAALFLGTFDLGITVASFFAQFFILWLLIWVMLWMVKLAFLGYLFGFLKNIIHATVAGSNHTPDFPDVDIQQDIVPDSLHLLAVFLLCTGPSIALTLMAPHHPWMRAAIIPAAVLGVTYFPMALLAVAMHETVTALSPLLIIPSILKVPVKYLVACILLAAVVTARWLAGTVLQFALPITLLAIVVRAFVELYFMTVLARLLGLLYFTNADELQWLRLRRDAVSPTEFH